MNQYHALKDLNRRQWTHEALHGVGRVESFPSLVALTTLEKCNFRCIMCSQDHSSKTQISAQALQQIEAVLPHVDDVAITGGEPFLYEHIDEFFRICHAGGCAPIVQTNGSLLRERQRRMLIERGVATLKISCDGATPATYNRIRRGGDFLNLYNNILRLTELKAAQGTHLPAIQFNFVAMRSNIEELVHLTLLASKLGVQCINVFMLLAETEDMARESLFFHQELADSHLRRARDAGSLCGVKLNLPPLFCEEIAAQQPAGQERPCFAPWRIMTVNVDGSVAICCGGAGLAGNLNTDSFDEVWNHPLRRKVRETVNTSRKLPCCRNCRQGRSVPRNVFAHIPNAELAQKTLAHFGLPAEAPPEQSAAALQ